jgi:hypothetical protein
VRASSRWPREDLLAVALELQRQGYSLPQDGVAYYSKRDLALLINQAERPNDVYGVHVNDLVVTKRQWCWEVCRPDNRPLVTIDFTKAYEWATPVGAVPDLPLLTALEVCLVREPLTAEDRQRLEQKRPGLTSKPLFEVDLDAWEVEDDEEPEPPALPVVRRPAPPPPPEAEPPRPLSPKRKIRL